MNKAFEWSSSVKRCVISQVPKCEFMKGGRK
jgi:hypothetical protein